MSPFTDIHCEARSAERTVLALLNRAVIASMKFILRFNIEIHTSNHDMARFRSVKTVRSAERPSQVYGPSILKSNFMVLDVF